jgi:hypothetical protein
MSLTTDEEETFYSVHIRKIKTEQEYRYEIICEGNDGEEIFEASAIEVNGSDFALTDRASFDTVENPNSDQIIVKNQSDRYAIRIE